MIEGLVESFSALDDPRCPGKVEYRLVDVLVIAVCTVVAEAETFEDIALYGRCKEGWLRGFPKLPGGVPSHDTFRRVLMLVDPDAFERCFLAWVREAFRKASGGGPERIAVDGKSVRRFFDRKHGRSPLHLISAYATGRGLVLALRAVDGKGGEVAVLPTLLDGLHLEGYLVSLDALSCRREVAEHVVSRGTDCLLTLKGNQGKVHDEVRALAKPEVCAGFAEHAFDRGADLRPCRFQRTAVVLTRRRLQQRPELARSARPARARRAALCANPPEPRHTPVSMPPSTPRGVAGRERTTPPCLPFALHADVRFAARE